MTANVAQTIKEQIGFWTLANLGASDFKHYTDAVQFKIRQMQPGTQKVRVMTVTVQLMPTDTYKVTIHYMKGRFDHQMVMDLDDVYADMLAELFKPETIERTGKEQLKKEKQTKRNAPAPAADTHTDPEPETPEDNDDGPLTLF